MLINFWYTILVYIHIVYLMYFFKLYSIQFEKIHLSRKYTHSFVSKVFVKCSCWMCVLPKCILSPSVYKQGYSPSLFECRRCPTTQSTLPIKYLFETPILHMRVSEVAFHGNVSLTRLHNKIIHKNFFIFEDLLPQYDDGCLFGSARTRRRLSGR